MFVFNILTIFVGVVSIIVNIWIAKYNVGKNRVIYEIIQVNSNDVNQKLNSGDYTILYVGRDNWDKTIYTLGKVNPVKSI